METYKDQKRGNIDYPEEFGPFCIRPELLECASDEVETNSDYEEESKAC